MASDTSGHPCQPGGTTAAPSHLSSAEGARTCAYVGPRLEWSRRHCSYKSAAESDAMKAGKVAELRRGDKRYRSIEAMNNAYDHKPHPVFDIQSALASVTCKIRRLQTLGLEEGCSVTYRSS